MYPGHQPGVPATWNYPQFSAQMPPGFYAEIFKRNFYAVFVTIYAVVRACVNIIA